MKTEITLKLRHKYIEFVKKIFEPLLKFGNFCLGRFAGEALGDPIVTERDDFLPQLRFRHALARRFLFRCFLLFLS